MKPILPSTKLLCTNVHKCQATSCPRYYFWYWILNMVPKGLNMNFWWGTVLGEGVEILLETKSLKKALAAMDVAHKEEIKNQLLDTQIKEELDFQLEMLKRIVTVWYKVRKEYIESIEITVRESKFSVELKQSPVIFNGALDAEGKADKVPIMIEIKSASSMSLNNDYFAHLAFDKQINGYRAAIEQKSGIGYGKCHYLVFRKPMIQVKQSETPDEFLDRLTGDLEKRADWYYIKFVHIFGKRATANVLNDIEGITFDLYAKYGYLNTDQLMDPINWPRNDRQCFNYGTCPYFRLCSDCRKYALYARCFRQRDLRYPLELNEVDKTRALIGPKLLIKRKEDRDGMCTQ